MTTPSAPTSGRALTIVLVHGGFADASTWVGVISELQSDGLQVRAPDNPLRGVNSDAAYIASVASQSDGPVLLVGHSYGGAVITVAGAAADDVVGLVYIAAFIPDEGESLADILAGYPDTQFATAARPAEFPLEGTGERAVPRSLRRRSAERGRGGGGCVPTPVRHRGSRGEGRCRGVEDAALLGGGGHRR